MSTDIGNVIEYFQFKIGAFEFKRDEYFAHISWPGGAHSMPVESFLRAMIRDVAWNFFYGTVFFDDTIGTTNQYGRVEFFAARNRDVAGMMQHRYSEFFDTPYIKNIFQKILDDWTNEEFDPLAAPRETGRASGWKNGNNHKSLMRERVTAKRMVGIPGDASLRSDLNGYPVNPHFKDVDQSEPKIFTKPGFENCLHAFNLFAYLSRSDVTWNPSVCSVLRDSLFCPTTEEYILPIIHGNDRMEWFIQLTDEITWVVEDKETGELLAKVYMRPGDVSAMPADIRHRGFASKRAMLLVWENASLSIDKLNHTKMNSFE